MKYYLEGKLLFIDMNHKYTHAVVECDPPRVLACQRTEKDAIEVCKQIKLQKYKKVDEMKELLEKGHAYMSKKNASFGTDIKEQYPTAGLLVAGIRSLEKYISSIRIVRLDVEE